MGKIWVSNGVKTRALAQSKRIQTAAKTPFLTENAKSSVSFRAQRRIWGRRPKQEEKKTSGYALRFFAAL